MRLASLDRKPQDDEAPLILAQAAVTTNAAAEAQGGSKAAVQKTGETAALDVGLAHLEQIREIIGAAADLERAKALDPKSGAVFWAYGILTSRKTIGSRPRGRSRWRPNYLLLDLRSDWDMPSTKSGQGI